MEILKRSNGTIGRRDRIGVNDDKLAIHQGGNKTEDFRFAVSGLGGYIATIKPVWRNW
jgi:hypothetical protein